MKVKIKINGTQHEHDVEPRKAVKSCTMFAVQADGAEITTVEGQVQGGIAHTPEKLWKVIQDNSAKMKNGAHYTADDVRKGKVRIPAV